MEFYWGLEKKLGNIIIIGLVQGLQGPMAGWLPGAINAWAPPQWDPTFDPNLIPSLGETHIEEDF